MNPDVLNSNTAVRIFLSIIFFLLAITASAQGISKSFVDSLFKATYPTFSLDSVVAYDVNGETFTLQDTLALNNRLGKIAKDSIAKLYYLPFNNRNYKPVKTIHVSTVKKQHEEDIRALLAYASSKLAAKRSAKGKNILKSKLPLLVVDYVQVEDAKAREVIRRLDLSKVFSVAINDVGKPVSVYGKPSENGMIQIWLRKGL